MKLFKKPLSQQIVEQALAPVVSTSRIHGISITKNQVSLILEADTALSQEENETQRRQCINHLLNLGQIKEAKIALTAAKGSLPQDKQTPPAGKTAPKPPTPRHVPHIRHVIAVGSGKGGVGKSTVSVNLATALARSGLSVGLADGDILGPSLARMMGITQEPEVENQQMIPPSHHGVKCLSMGAILGENVPVVWRGPMVTKALQQLVFGAKWGSETQPLDVLVLDLPPGTGDIQLTMVQNITLSGVVLVSTPQQVALMDVKKAHTMFNKVEVPVLGIVENMAGIQQADGSLQPVFGASGKEGNIAHYAAETHIPFLGSLPLDGALSTAGDAGSPLKEGQLTDIFDDIALEIRQKLALN